LAKINLSSRRRFILFVFPIRLLSFIGLLIAVLGFAYAFDIFIEKIFGEMKFTGWAPIMIISLSSEDLNYSCSA